MLELWARGRDSVEGGFDQPVGGCLQLRWPCFPCLSGSAAGGSVCRGNWFSTASKGSVPTGEPYEGEGRSFTLPI